MITGKVKEMGINKDIGGLIELLDYNEECIVRSNAALVLGEIGDIIAVDPLINSLNDEDYIVRGSAAWLLVRLMMIVQLNPLLKHWMIGIVMYVNLRLLL
jgi:HEAT repeat protein